ncbi:uncharacterized protein LOC111825344 [Myotis lucifugus]|uniref:uncharacterized protein LOC111825344 n=1 Tax=Myotis lucifugus TaxID=59463 RepID=UPI000CCC44F3|nr:uncharacterized protein LOC111825344 [Myotis lucifugus]
MEVCVRVDSEQVWYQEARREVPARVAWMTVREAKRIVTAPQGTEHSCAAQCSHFTVSQHLEIATLIAPLCRGEGSVLEKLECVRLIRRGQGWSRLCSSGAGRVHTRASVLAAPGIALCGVPCEQVPTVELHLLEAGQSFHAWAAGGSHPELNHIFTRRTACDAGGAGPCAPRLKPSPGPRLPGVLDRKVAVVVCEVIYTSGNFYRNKLRCLAFLHKQMNTNPSRSPTASELTGGGMCPTGPSGHAAQDRLQASMGPAPG